MPLSRMCISLRCLTATLVVHCTLCNCLAQDPFQGNPIPSGPEAKIHAEFQKGMAEYYQQLWESYQKNTADPEPIRSEALKFFAGVTQADVYGSTEPESLNKRRELSQRLIDQGSRDPLVLQRHAWIEWQLGNVNAARQMWMECETALSDGKYGQLPLIWNGRFLCYVARVNEEAEPLNEYASRAMQPLLEWTLAESAKVEQLRSVNGIMKDAFLELPPERRNQFLASLEGRPGVDPWIHDILRAQHEINLALGWRDGRLFPIQGAPVGQQVSHWEAALECLTRAWKSHPDFPEAAGLMITVAIVGVGEGTPRLWFDRAVAAEMDHPEAYLRFIDAMLFSQSDSRRAMYRFGVECLATKRFDTLVPVKFLDIVLQVSAEPGTRIPFGRFMQFDDSSQKKIDLWKHPAVYEKFQELFTGMKGTARNDIPGRTMKNRGYVTAWQTAVALKTEHWRDAIGLLDSRSGDHPDFELMGVLRDVNLTARQIGKAYPCAEDGKDSYLAAEELLAGGDPTPDSLARARELLVAAQAKCKDPRAIAFLAARTRACDDLANFRAGKSVHLTFDSDFPNWDPARGTWSIKGDDKIASWGLPVEDLTAQADCLMKFDLPFQIECDFEFATPPTTAVTAGVMFRGDKFDGDVAKLPCFLWVSGLGVGVQTKTNYLTIASTQGTAQRQLKIRVWPDIAMIFVDGNGPYFTSPGTFQASNQIGLTVTASSPHSPQIQFSNARICKLPYGPPVKADAATRLKYGQEMLDFDPSDLFALKQRSRAYYDLGMFPEAIADFQTLKAQYPKSAEFAARLSYTLAQTGQLDEAWNSYQDALANLQPGDFEPIRMIAELECMEGTRFYNPEAALQHAFQVAQQLRELHAVRWAYAATLARAYAECGNFEEALPYLERAAAEGPREVIVQVRERIAVLQDRHRKSYRVAAAALFWKGNWTNRIIGLAVFILLLASNLALARRFWSKGWLVGMTAGAASVGISLLIPAVLAIFFRVGEGPAFLQLLLACLVVGALVGAGFGAWAGARAKRQADAIPEGLAR